MTITTIVVANSDDPTEVQSWFNANLMLTIYATWSAGKTFYIIHD